ncbi:MAG: hypothetical protein NXY57DRAFT_282944 [Lentinula lateritia]|nr:MAG: hypothetical protein NXY57DRAFT_282944 [Lentinula lateritia]
MFSISKWPTVARTPTRSEQVRLLWVDFELWHVAQSQEIENKIKIALKDLDQKWRTKSRRLKKDSKELEEEKTKARLALENTLDGNVVRQEWERRLSNAGLVSEDWVDITDEEQRKVELILGADLEFEEDDHRRFHESYAVVDPNSFHSLDDAWLEVKQTLRSDDQLSLNASTSSASSISEAWNGPAYALWSSEASRSSAQSSQTSSPEWPNKYLASDASSASSSRPSTSTSMSSSSHSRSKSHGHYIGPQLTSDTDEDEESSFEKWKLALRIRKIREFHDDAADADTQLTLDLDEARRTKSWSKEDEAQRVRAHEVDMIALRERKEMERKADVDSERQRRMAELRQPSSTERDFNTTAQKFLKTLHLERDSPSISDTPTIRQSAFVRTRKQSLSHLQQQEWPESGNDTPTPTARTSTWNFKKENLASAASTLGEAPPLKRLPTGPVHVTSTSGTKVPLPSIFGESVSASNPKVAVGPAPSPTAQVSTKNAPNAVVSVAASVSSSSKKSKKEKEKAEKEKAKAGKKSNTAPVEKNESSNAEANLRNNDTIPVGMTMPGQWGWGGDLNVASSTSVAPAVTGNPSSTSNVSFLASTPSTSSATTLSSSSHASPYSHPFGSSSTSNTSLPAHSFSAPPPVSFPITTAPTIKNQTSHVHAAVPDNRRVWLPPSALETSNSKNMKGKQSIHTMLEVPAPVPAAAPATQIHKSTSGPVNLAGNSPNLNLSTGAGMLDVPMPTHIQKSVSGSPDVSLKVESAVFPAVTAAAPPSSISQGAQLNSRESHSVKPGVKATHTSSVSPAQPTGSSAPSGSTALPPSSSLTSSSSKKKSKGKKKVTIEETQDEESANVSKGKGIERLPVDSRYIIEPISEPEAPRPVVAEPQAQEMFKDILEYDSLKALPISTSVSTSSLASENQQSGYNVWAPPTASTASSSSSSLPQNDHARWIPKGGAHESFAIPDKQEKKVRWTPNAYSYDAPNVLGQGQQDVFLSALDSLEAIIRDENGGHSLDGHSAVMVGAGKRDASKKSQGRGKAESNSDDTFWQHAMASLGRGGSNVLATSAI